MPPGVVNRLWEELKPQGSSLTKTGRAPEEYHVFCSFDLVNSTALKAKNKTWPVIISSFSDFVIDAVSKRVKDLAPWKFLGDEVVFTQQIRRFQDLPDLLPKIYDTLRFVIGRIHETFPEARGLVSVRATAWGAFCLNGVGDLEQTSKKVADQPDRNIRIGRRKGGELKELVEPDFMGPSIDEGFRLQRFAPRGRLAVSAELAYFVSQGGGKARKIAKCLRIVSFEVLKGIWSERRYPIVWYDENWDKLLKTFCYDERYTDPLVEKLLKDGPPHHISELKKVFSDLGEFDRLRQGYRILRRLRPAKKTTKRFQQPSELSLLHLPAQHVHCVAVCLDGRGRCLIAKRPKAKRLFPGHWEFGCGQLTKGESFENCLVEAYRDDFNARLDRATLHPLSTFMIEGNPQVPGIIFTGKVSNPQTMKAKKHTELRWITAKDLPKYAKELCVPKFKETALDAFGWHKSGDET